MANCRQWRFPFKLHGLLIKGETGVALQWNAKGSAIRLDRQALRIFLASTESNPFKTKSVDSFIRQLHLYGFRLTPKKEKQRKPSLHEDNCLIKDEKHVAEYWHPFFTRSRPDFLDYVQRRTLPKKKTSRCVFKEDNAEFRINQRRNKSVSLQTKEDPLEPVEKQQLLSLKSESPSDFYRKTPESSFLQEENAVASQCQLTNLFVDTLPPQEEEYLGNFENHSYAVLQHFDPSDQNNSPQIEPNADRNVFNIYTQPGLYLGQSTTLYRDFGEGDLLSQQPDLLGHQVSSATLWQLTPSVSFSTQTSESLEYFGTSYIQEVEINSETESESITQHVGYE